ncbi:glycosyl transferase family 2 [Pseudopedobacter saltans DSM 12145]|uniref:Glycosyl transferase family 2 n=1 Tax=Pseudopedobacter saltans (strain ATCC 51119 / DSM 12145 / JCM 21818 / CCUG 39354 / LMG 10337 / NBRC 100064 / NCIMB 13643) TaxID=762903 RepID=F0SD85_PSESL|nr:glycosyltransferase [Pseudopedobacter saltans]ADY52871.1 glycosyl transferase family 2 [Pseudopedobacter saltans DSM 12145]
MNNGVVRVLSIIVTYNALRNNWIEKCVSSLLSSNFKTDIIIIDNASTDNTTRYIEQNYSSVKLIKSEKNLGFGQANSVGLKKCLAENYNYAFLLNQDAWVEEDTLEKLIKVSENNTNYGIISPIHLNGEGNALDFNFSNYIIPNNCKGFFSDIFLNKQKEIYEVKFVNAAAWLITKECIEKVGGFSPIFYHYGEDENYCHRALYHQLRIGVTPGTVIYHDRENRVEFSSPQKQWNNTVRAFNIHYANPNNKTSILKYYITLLKISITPPFLFKKFIQHILSFNPFYFSKVKNESKKIKVFL